ncbi:GyrI-like domain-containing protein [Sediminispirochaeta bajacaliforniensis]|uniref:GyrI-like domain-containing protein n=1 Tax=Sediminispirochaeta bajacaliforniensis TaxID=148 RepID=UPI00035DC2B5|nr:GyrI-like domain-containing protein [Sediminispirochaeta bajacaliforniensis]
MNVELFHERIRELYLPPSETFSVVEVPSIRYAAIEGSGDPASTNGKEASKWLFSMAHVVKPFIKERMGSRFVEPPIEWQITVHTPRDWVSKERNGWRWRAMIVFVDWINQEMFEDAKTEVAARLGEPPRSLRLMEIHEGKCVQIMHVGDYDGVRDTCEKLYKQFLPENDLQPRDHYHEIYLNDPDRTAPKNRKMVIRQPVQ